MFFKQIIKRILRRLNPGKKTTGFEPELTDPVYQRFLTSNPIAYKKAIDAAQQYVSKLEEGNYKWLFTKPYESSPGNKEYFRLMYDLLNILKAMNIPSGARILEVGSGPGWITEILLMLGFSVDALEPSEDMIKIAKERCSVYTHYNSEAKHKVNYHQSTIEEIEFEEERFDAVLFFDSLHHVVDEGIAINKSFRFLKPGGYLGVVEGAWHPSNTELERVLMAEMKKYGTLENPFTTEYIDHILTNSGFTDIQRYVGVNGFYSKTQLTQIINDLSGISMAGSNNITARKPEHDAGTKKASQFLSEKVNGNEHHDSHQIWEMENNDGSLTHHLVRDMYLCLLKREPDIDGLNYWVTEVKNGLKLADVFTGITEGAEYKSRLSSLQNQ